MNKSREFYPEEFGEDVDIVYLYCGHNRHEIGQVIKVSDPAIIYVCCTNCYDMIVGDVVDSLMKNIKGFSIDIKGIELK